MLIDVKDSGKLSWEFSGIFLKFVRMQGHSYFQKFWILLYISFSELEEFTDQGIFREYVKNCKGARALISLSEFKDSLGIVFQ